MNRKKTDSPINRKCISVLLPLLLFILLSPAPGYSGEFILFYSNDIRGETEPCG